MLKNQNRFLLVSILCLSVCLSGCGAGEQAEAVSQQAVSASEPSSQEETTASSLPEAGTEITTNGGEVIPVSSLEHQDEAADSVVYIHPRSPLKRWQLFMRHWARVFPVKILR